MQEKIKQFAELVEKEHIEELRKDGLGCEANIHNAKTSIKLGKKYTKVDVGPSGKYMIDAEGNIYGIKAYGVIHKGHHYGTLDTINAYYWGRFHGIKKS